MLTEVAERGLLKGKTIGDRRDDAGSQRGDEVASCGGTTGESYRSICGGWRRRRAWKPDDEELRRAGPQAQEEGVQRGVGEPARPGSAK